MDLCKHNLYLVGCSQCSEVISTLCILYINGSYAVPYKYETDHFVCIGYNVETPDRLNEDVCVNLSEKEKFVVDVSLVPRGVVTDLLQSLLILCRETETGFVYEHHCWACKGEISSFEDTACAECKWYVCQFCSACGCEYTGPVRHGQSTNVTIQIKSKRDKYQKVIVYLKGLLAVPVG